MTNQMIEVRWSVGSLDEARTIARHLVQERLVVCAQIIPWIESIFIWNEQLDTVQESKVILKTELRLYEKIRDFIKQKCSYEVPEISYVILDGMNSEYEEWLKTSLNNY